MSVKYHFFGKDCFINQGLSERSHLNSELNNKNLLGDSVLFVNQIHGGEVVTVDSADKIHGNQNLPKADAIVTNLPNITLGLITADCAPVLFFDSQKKIIGAAHAGWRGAKIGVISEIVAEMKKLGAENIEALIGPMIQQESYEVSQEFFEDFTRDDQENKTFFKDGLVSDKYFFDLPSYVEKKLKESGIRKITNSKIDTYTNEEEFFSFRRSIHRKESDSGRNVSVIMCEDKS